MWDPRIIHVGKIYLTYICKIEGPFLNLVSIREGEEERGRISHQHGQKKSLFYSVFFFF